MGSLALMGMVSPVSMAGPSTLPTSSSSLLGGDSGIYKCPQLGVVQLRGGVVAALPVRMVEVPQRSSFGGGSSVFSSTSRPGFRTQAAKQTFTSFDDMLKNCGVPVLVDFYAVWCGPCQFMVPVLDEVNKALKDKIRVVKVDTEKYPDLASRFNIYALPTLVLFKDGKSVDRMEGALKADELVIRIQKVL